MVILVLELGLLLFSLELYHKNMGRAFLNNNNVVPSAVALTITTPVMRCAPQSISGVSNITVSGTYSGGAVDCILARAIPSSGMSGTDTGNILIQNAPTGGTYSGTLVLPRGGWYTLTVYAIKNSQVAGTAFVSQIGSGDVILTCGQSLDCNYAQTAQSVTSALVNSLDLSGNIYNGNDPQPIVQGSGGTPWPAFASAIAAHTNCPVTMISTGVPSTSVTTWLPSISGGNYQTNLKPALTLLGTGFLTAIWMQGESDSTASTTQATYQTDLRTMISQSRTDAGWTIPWGICNTETYDSGIPSNAGPIQAAQASVATDANNYSGFNMDNYTSSTYRFDGVHLTAQGCTTAGQGWASIVISQFSL
jgi:Carbohydrate esterase, sialic acid-specific acetylesterase